jgi:hypothetical protein
MSKSSMSIPRFSHIPVRGNPSHIPPYTPPRLLTGIFTLRETTDVLQALSGLHFAHENAIIAVIGIIVCGTGERYFATALKPSVASFLRGLRVCVLCPSWCERVRVR